ncbi:UDP-N-acetyl glucosamine 2-epimerase, partial [Klebsiella pneumoniae]|uniref:UDP-N-acetylglucosamine 2-epimerase n=1 Tax=Klebsiella pneumoniae TaxID=573 RepID=UPI001B8D7199
LEEICDAILEIVNAHPDVKVVFPVHLNPNVQKIVHDKLDHARIELCAPLGYEEFAVLMKQSYLLLTDSGGIQEEAPYLKKPIF